MNFIVSDIQRDDKNIIVCGITEIGVIKGIWKYGEPPVMLKPYNVELSHTEFDVKKSDEQKVYAEILRCDECVHFCGICEDIDEEVYYIRFSDGSLDMAEIPVKCDDIKKGDYISFNVRYGDLEIYPY